ncbi:MAG: PrpR N-terminal domain-containing protein, partial [Erysipelotrichales bacterium]|nr:PrpR N-terminal domain-containing protein [Erysipelotrichales bacterium]
MRKIRLMAIAPYEGLMDAIQIAEKQHEHECTIDCLLGDLYSGAELAKDAEAKGYDAILSRGGTADMISAAVRLPVVSIEASGYDYLRAIKLAENIKGKKAVLGFARITSHAKEVNEVLQTNIDTFTVHEQEEIAPKIRELIDEGYALIIGDVATRRVAMELGMKALLLTSGYESIHEAIDRAVQLVRFKESAKTENDFLKEIIDTAGDAYAIADDRIQFIYQSAAFKELKLPLTEILRLIGRCEGEGGSNLVFQREKTIVSVNAYRKPGDFPLFYLVAKEVYFGTEIEKEKAVAVTGYTYPLENLRDYLNNEGTYDQTAVTAALAAAKTNNPLLIGGPVGVGKHKLAKAIHRAGAYYMRPFIMIYCRYANPIPLINKILEQNMFGTICLDEVDRLDASAQNDLVHLLRKTDPRNFRLIALISKKANHREWTGAADGEFLDFFSPFVINLSGINETGRNLGKIVNLYIMDYNEKLGTQITGITPEALDVLSQCELRRNFSELHNIVQQ